MIKTVIKEILKIIIGSFLSFILLMIVINFPLLVKKPNTGSIISTNENNRVLVASSPTLYIPKIDVKAPIIFTEKIKDIDNDLEKGVSHYPGTALPGRRGNVFLVGHSSDYPWKAGDFKQIFVFLGQLEKGDKFYIDYEGERYTYIVTTKKIIESDDRSILKTNDNDKKMTTLMTCYPPNTLLKRLIVQGFLQEKE